MSECVANTWDVPNRQVYLCSVNAMIVFRVSRAFVTAQPHLIMT